MVCGSIVPSTRWFLSCFYEFYMNKFVSKWILSPLFFQTEKKERTSANESGDSNEWRLHSMNCSLFAFFIFFRSLFSDFCHSPFFCSAFFTVVMLVWNNWPSAKIKTEWIHMCFNCCHREKKNRITLTYSFVPFQHSNIFITKIKVKSHNRNEKEQRDEKPFASLAQIVHIWCLHKN